LIRVTSESIDLSSSRGSVVTKHSLASHLNVNRYGDFLLTDAVRPGQTVPIVPREAYRLESFRDPLSHARIPLLSASISADKLFDVFLELLDPVGEVVHVILESSHANLDDDHDDSRRGHIDLPVLKSHLCDFEDLLLNDGCTGIAVIASKRMVEVQLDEHKQLYIYGRNLLAYRSILKRHGIRRNDRLELLSESEHLHHSTPGYAEEYRQLCCRLGAGDFDSVLSDDNGFFAT
jgi:hypothetical protein